MTQQLLAPENLKPFYTDTATADQVRNFLALRPMMDLGERPTVVDVGGGHGFFARALKAEIRGSVSVLDTDPVSIAACHANGVTASIGDAMHPPIMGDEDVICFNLILHHLVGRREATTAAMQRQALEVWRGKARFIFVTEYCFSTRLATRLMYWGSRSRVLAAPLRVVGHVAHSLRSNTLGVGVRYRSHDEWLEFFHAAGFATVAAVKGREEKVSLARRICLRITSTRRDTFLLAAK